MNVVSVCPRICGSVFLSGWSPVGVDFLGQLLTNILYCRPPPQVENGSGDGAREAGGSHKVRPRPTANAGPAILGCAGGPRRGEGRPRCGEGAEGSGCNAGPDECVLGQVIPDSLAMRLPSMQDGCCESD